MAVLERVRLRISIDEASDDMMNEYIQTISDRLKLRLGVGQAEELPDLFQSICVDATVKMFRRTYYEGISSENTDGISDSFVDDILAEYQDEINSYLNDKELSGNGLRKVRFI